MATVTQPCTISREFSVGGDTIKTEESISAGKKTFLAGENIPMSATDMAVTFAIDVSALKAIHISCDQDVTVETNSSSAPDDTLAIVADSPYEWTENSLHSCLITADVTVLYVTNASGVAATLKVITLEDATP